MIEPMLLFSLAGALFFNIVIFLALRRNFTDAKKFCWFVSALIAAMVLLGFFMTEEMERLVLLSSVGGIWMGYFHAKRAQRDSVKFSVRIQGRKYGYELSFPDAIRKLHEESGSVVNKKMCWIEVDGLSNPYKIPYRSAIKLAKQFGWIRDGEISLPSKKVDVVALRKAVSQKLQRRDAIL